MVDTSPHADRQVLALDERVARLEQDYSQDPGKAQELAQAYLADGRPQEARRVLEKRRGDRSQAETVLLACAYFDLFKPQRAETLLKQAEEFGSLEENARAQLVLGELALDGERPKEAASHLRKALQLDPNCKQAAVLLGNLGEDVEVTQPTLESYVPWGFRTQQADAETPARAVRHVALGALVAVLALGAYWFWVQRSHAAKVLIVEARRMAQAGDVASLRLAEAKYLQAIALKAGSDRALAGLAYAYALLWVDHGLDEAKTRAIEYVTRGRDEGVEEAEQVGAAGLVQLGLGKPREALDVVMPFINRPAVSEQLHYVAGLARRRLGQHASGREDLRRAAEFRSLAPHYACALGDAYDEDAEPNRAALYWERAHKSNSAYLPAYARSLLARLRRGEPADTLRRSAERLRNLPENRIGKRALAAVEMVRSEILRRQGRTKEALMAIDGAIALEGATAMLLGSRAGALLAAGQVEPGLQAFRKALEASHFAKEYLLATSDAHVASGHAEQAVALLKRGSENLGEDPDYAVALGNALRAQGDLAAAAKQYEQVIDSHRSHPQAQALLERGVLAWQSKDYRQAETWFGKAVGARPAFPAVYEAVGLMWLEQGAVTEADVQLREAERLLRTQRTDLETVARFYGRVIAAYHKAKIPRARSWAERQEEFMGRHRPGASVAR